MQLWLQKCIPMYVTVFLSFVGVHNQNWNTHLCTDVEKWERVLYEIIYKRKLFHDCPFFELVYVLTNYTALWVRVGEEKAHFKNGLLCLKNSLHRSERQALSEILHPTEKPRGQVQLRGLEFVNQEGCYLANSAFFSFLGISKCYVFWNQQILARNSGYLYSK